MNSKKLKYIYQKYGMTNQEIKLKEETREVIEVYKKLAETGNNLYLKALIIEICDYLNMFQQVHFAFYQQDNFNYRYLNLLFINIPKKFRFEIIEIYIYHYRVIQKCRAYKIKRTLKKIKEKRNGQNVVHNWFDFRSMGRNNFIIVTFMD